jgi:TolA-binding protein
MSWRSRFGRGRGCPAGWELSRALSEGTDFDVMVHVRGCVRCAAEWAALARTGAEARALPGPAMSETSRHQIEARLLGAVSGLARSGPRPPRERVWARAAGIALLASGAAATMLISVRGADHHTTATSAGAPSLASIRAVGAAAFARTQPPPDEIVRLDDGTLEMNVAPPTGGRRFRVATADAEVEAQGGRFDVAADGHRLITVRVIRGHVEVRASGGGRAALNAGDEWTRAASPAREPRPAPSLAPTAPSERPVAPPVALAHAARVAHVERAASAHAERAPSVPAERAALAIKTSARAALALAPTEPAAVPPAASAPQRVSFERGWRLLRAGDPAHAAEAFQEVDQESGGDAIQEDALFWQAVALARAGKEGAAGRALSSFIERFPRSARAGEASAMLGWMLIDAGDTDGARRAFERAVGDRVDRVRASARSGLGHLAGSRPAPSTNPTP